MIEPQISTGDQDRIFENEIESAAPKGIYINDGLEEWAHERIIIHRATIRDLIHSDDADREHMLFLYCFYYETGRYQKTNQPWCVDTFVINGLHWGKDKFYRVKKKLLEKDFIEQKRGRRKDGTLGKSYIRVNYMSKAPESSNQPQSLLTRSSKVPPVANQDTNALRPQHEMLKDNNRGHVVVESRNYGKLKIPHERINVDYEDKDLQNAIALLDAQKNVENPIGFLIKAIGKKWKSEEPIIQDTRREDTQKYLHQQHEIAEEISKQSTGITDQGITGLREAVYKNE